MIGMPGSGKSTLGKILASRIGYDFLDTDDLLIAHYQKPLMHIIEERGVEGFIQAEGEILQTVQVSHTVLATGGSAVYSHQAMEYLRTIGTVLYLKYDVSDIAARVGNLLTRGVVCRNCTTLQVYTAFCRIDLTKSFRNIIESAHHFIQFSITLSQFH